MTADTHRWEEPQIPIPIRSLHDKPRQTKSLKSASLTVLRNRGSDQHTSLSMITRNDWGEIDSLITNVDIFHVKTFLMLVNFAINEAIPT